MGNRDERLRAETLEWLLDPEHPSVRYRALRDLLRRPEGDPEVTEAQAAIAGSCIVKRIFARQQPRGYWGDPITPYQPKYKATYWTLMLLGHLGVTREDEPVQRAVEYIFQFQHSIGGFSECGLQGAQREYAYVARKRRDQGKDWTEGEETFVAQYMHQMTLSCLTGNIVAALFRLGYRGDARVWRAVDWLVEIQRKDGGWLCPHWRAHVRDKHSCFHGTICALEGLSEIPPDSRSRAVERALAQAVEFLLMHRLYRSDHHDWRVINPRWLRLAFPWFADYTVLRGLWVLARLGVRDERLTDALDVLRQKRLADGRWVLESTPYGRMQAVLEKKGQPSKWVTLKALEALEHTETQTAGDQ